MKGMDKQGAYTRILGDEHATFNSVSEQCRTQFHPLCASINRQTR